jgi:hypothetical protein
MLDDIEKSLFSLKESLQKIQKDTVRDEFDAHGEWSQLLQKEELLQAFTQQLNFFHTWSEKMCIDLHGYVHELGRRSTNKMDPAILPKDCPYDLVLTSKHFAQLTTIVATIERAATVEVPGKGVSNTLRLRVAFRRCQSLFHPAK